MAEAWGPKVAQLLMEALVWLIFAGAFLGFVGFKWFQVVFL